MTNVGSIGVVLLLCVSVYAEPADLVQRSRSAVERALPVVQKAARSYPSHRTCFSCHHQTLPMEAMSAAATAGLAIDKDLLVSQAEFTHKSFRDRIGPMRQGKGIGGRALTVSYALWALAIAERKSDEVTDAMIMYLLKEQAGDGHWTFQTRRPPMEDSNVMSTALAIYGLQHYAGAAQREQSESAIRKGAEWLDAARIESQEDRNGLLWGRHLAAVEPAKVEAARKQVLDSQRSDGGWAQLDAMESDAYATGQTLVVLSECNFKPTDPAYQRGVEYLLKTQLGDGSWLVKTRSKPIQTFFDNGDPHGADQFISIPATSWAAAALARTIVAN